MKQSQGCEKMIRSRLTILFLIASFVVLSVSYLLIPSVMGTDFILTFNVMKIVMFFLYLIAVYLAFTAIWKNTMLFRKYQDRRSIQEIQEIHICLTQNIIKKAPMIEVPLEISKSTEISMTARISIRSISTSASAFVVEKA